ncbi:hypothetical protein D3C81_1576130 [compost metagenome]
MLTGFVRGDGAVVLVTIGRLLIAAVDGAERCAFESGAFERFVRIPAVAGDEIFVLGSRVNRGVTPLEIDVAILDFRQVPANGGLCVHGREQRVTAAGDLAIDRPLQGSTANAGRKALEGFTDALWLVLRTATVGVQACLASQCARRRHFQIAVSRCGLRGQHCR